MILKYGNFFILPLMMHKGLFYTNIFITFLSNTKNTSQLSMNTVLILVRNELFWYLLSLERCNKTHINKGMCRLYAIGALRFTG